MNECISCAQQKVEESLKIRVCESAGDESAHYRYPQVKKVGEAGWGLGNSELDFNTVHVAADVYDLDRNRKFDIAEYLTLSRTERTNNRNNIQTKCLLAWQNSRHKSASKFYF